MDTLKAAMLYIQELQEAMQEDFLSDHANDSTSESLSSPQTGYSECLSPPQTVYSDSLSDNLSTLSNSNYEPFALEPRNHGEYQQSDMHSSDCLTSLPTIYSTSLSSNTQSEDQRAGSSYAYPQMHPSWYKPQTEQQPSTYFQQLPWQDTPNVVSHESILSLNNDQSRCSYPSSDQSHCSYSSSDKSQFVMEEDDLLELSWLFWKFLRM